MRLSKVFPDERTLYASAQASVHFALTCLEAAPHGLRARSSFVKPDGEAMHWHDFGDLEGPGWAANALGGAHLLHRWGAFAGDAAPRRAALGLLDHILEDGFIDRETGFIWPYYDLAAGRFCLTYDHGDRWLCPGSLARIGSQLLAFAGDLADEDPARAALMSEAAAGLGRWLVARVPPLDNGWVPRRITRDGAPYPLTPEGGPDPIFDHSADGLYLLQLYARLAALGLEGYAARAAALADAFIVRGGFWGSINHDTYDDHECVAYATAFRVLRDAAGRLGAAFPGQATAWCDFAYALALPGLERFRMAADRNGVATAGLLWMEASWDTAYLWENAEAAQAWLEASADACDERYRRAAAGVLLAIARHHYGDAGFLTEGVDWNNHVTRRHHVDGVLYGAINYTEPLLNNLHLVGPTLALLDGAGSPPMSDAEALDRVAVLHSESVPPLAGANGARYLIRLYFPALETDARVEQALAFVRAAGADGVLLFESSFDMDPALLTLDLLRERFARLRAVAPRFRQAGLAVHVNVMIKFGHVDAGCARPERFAFRFQVDEHGAVSRSTACPLDPAFLDYVAELYALAAGCDADVVWVDDDVRYILHDLSGLTCFCPLHLAALAERTGRAYDRAELVATLRSDLTLRAAWLDVQDDAMLGLAGAVERAVHAVSPRTRIGLMTIGTAWHAAEGRRTDRLLRALAGDGRLLIRPGSGFWNDWQPGSVLEKSEDAARQIHMLGADVQAAAEVENHPYTPWGKSERVLALELALDVLAGMPDLSLNLLTSMGGSGPLAPEGTDYAPLLRRLRPFLDALARERAGRLRCGADVADDERYAWGVSSPPDQPLRRAWVQPRPWEVMLGRAGIPLGRPGFGPHWIAGEVARAMSDYDLRLCLLEGAVLDPIAAQAVMDREWGGLLGLRSVRRLETAANERLTDHPFNGGRAGEILPMYNHLPYGQLYTFEFERGPAGVLGRWQGVDGEDIGPATAMIACAGAGTQAAGEWRIGLLPFALHTPTPALLNAARRDQWGALLAWAAGCLLPCRVVGAANLYPLAFAAPAGNPASWLLAVANLSADDAMGAGLDVSGCGPGPWAVERLDAAGRWRRARPAIDGRLPASVGHHDLAAYRLRRIEGGA
jgi:hypothetical protein